VANEKFMFTHTGEVSAPDRHARRPQKKSFPERLWTEAIATGQSHEIFWRNGARFSDDGKRIFYCAEALGPKLGIKPGTIAHNIRGYMGPHKPQRMTKKMFHRIFGNLMPYRGQVWIVQIPGLSLDTRDFSGFQWNSATQSRCERLINKSDETVGRADCDRDTGESADWSLLDPENLALTFAHQIGPHMGSACDSGDECTAPPEISRFAE
jgi:hypothetical protein